jgi:hypothetical protein
MHFEIIFENFLTGGKNMLSLLGVETLTVHNLSSET